MRPPYYAAAAALWVICCSNSMAQQDIHTFVNGTNQPAYDLHIQYNRAIDPKKSTYLNQSGSLPSSATASGNVLDVQWPQNMPLPAGASITIKGVAQGANDIGIVNWRWTDSNHVTMGSVKVGNARGTGSSAGDGIDQNGSYSIANHDQHWGGAGRVTNTVTINIYYKTFLSGLSAADQAGAESNIFAAVLQWANCTSPQTQGQVPIAGQGGNPANDGQGVNPPVMAPGPTHVNGGKGQKFRSVTDGEAGAIRVKYPQGLMVNIYPGMDRPKNQGGIQVHWGIPNEHAGATGVGIPSTDPKGPQDTTYKGDIYMATNKNGKPVKWYYPADNDGDGYISNADGPKVPADSYDFYSIFKHELGHVLSFCHAGEDFDDRPPRFGDPVPSGVGNASGGPCPGCGTPNGTSTGDADNDEPGPVYFSSDQPGGYGGMDIWRAYWDGTNWVQENLGPEVNTPYDETDPFLASDGTTLLFSSDRPGGFGGYDLYQSIYDSDSNIWSEALNLGTNVNTPFDERHPSLTADMLSLFLVSDQPGGFGGWDIWSSEYIWGEGWSERYNLGDVVNSPSNEVAACINATGDGLIIASDAPGGFGGLDLWLSTYGVGTNSAGWSQPINLGPTINSAANESDPSIRLDHAYLLFTSDRNPGGDTIYESYMRLPIQTYEDWVTNWFSDEIITNPAATAPFALDPGGVPNLLDYAFGCNPLLGQGTAGPTVYTVDTTNGPAIEFLFSRPLPGYDLTYQIQVSPDLQTWHYNGDVPGAVYIDEMETDPSIDVETIEFLPDPSLTWPAVFCRIAVQWAGP